MKDIKDYLDQRVAISCDTEEDWVKICKLAAKAGSHAPLEGRWETSSEEPIALNLEMPSSRWCRTSWYIKEGYTIFQASEFFEALYPIF
jgi:hypothetical protein